MELAGEETLHSDDFYLELDGIKMSARSLKSYGNEAQLNVVMKLLLKGGGVKRTIVKMKKSEKTLPTDKTSLENGFNTACLINTSATFDLKKALDEMDSPSLQKLHDYLVKDKSINSTKLKNIPSFLQPHVQLQQMIEKATSSRDTLQDLVEQDINAKIELFVILLPPTNRPDFLAI